MLREPAHPHPLQQPPATYVSYEEYLRIAPDNQIMEWVDGQLVTYMPASIKHQNLLYFLARLLGTFVSTLGIGQIVIAPYVAKLWQDGPAREPDLLFISPANANNIHESRLIGAPDLAIEIVSKSSVRQDRVNKFTEYEKAGVKEYWIIDPRPRKQHADFFILDEATQQFIEADVDENGIYRSAELPGFWLDVAWLWQTPHPNTALIEADILRNCAAVPDRLRQMYQTNYEILSQPPA